MGAYSFEDQREMQQDGFDDADHDALDICSECGREEEGFYAESRIAGVDGPFFCRKCLNDLAKAEAGS